MTNIKLSIIIPAYNEKSRIKETLDDVLNYIKKVDYPVEIIVIDDGSTDNTVTVVENYINKQKNIRIINYIKNMGKGYAVNKGVETAKGEFILFMDADNATRINEIERFWPWTQEGFEIIIGSRNINDKNTKVVRINSRKWFGVFSNFMIRVLLGLKFSDTQCGFKLFDARVGKELFKLQKIYRWGFDFEILAIAQKKNIKIKEVPVNWHEKSNSKVHPFTDLIKTFWELVKVAVTIRTNKY